MTTVTTLIAVTLRNKNNHQKTTSRWQASRPVYCMCVRKECMTGIRIKDQQVISTFVKMCRQCTLCNCTFRTLAPSQKLMFVSRQKNCNASTLMKITTTKVKLIIEVIKVIMLIVKILHLLHHLNRFCLLCLTTQFNRK